MKPRNPVTPRPAVSDRRYRSARWRRISDRVLGKTKTQRLPTSMCAWPDSPPHLAEVADHIVSVYPGMPDAEFYDERNVQPMCQHHNKAKGFLEKAGSHLGTAGTATTGGTTYRSIFTPRRRVPRVG